MGVAYSTEGKSSRKSLDAGGNQKQVELGCKGRDQASDHQE